MSDPHFTDRTVPTDRHRWRPCRAGIHNIWEYDHQVFEFSDGRLILRGPNGSGKSNALALFVPFLLDGVMAAHRMDSLGGGRSMRTLLLCLNEDEGSKQFRHEQRTGYVWLELERHSSDATGAIERNDVEHLTIGCGARASTQRDADAWFFVTRLRPGIDLDLVPGGVPLTRAGLRDAVGADAVHDSADAHRAAVDRELFGLGAHRYRNLVELLLVLRRPHLAGKLDLTHLSKVLSDGLAALDDQLVTDVAASFDDLEAVQRDLASITAAHATVSTFLPVYRRYVRATGRQRARAVLDAHRDLRAARRRVDQAANELDAAGREIERIDTERADRRQRTAVAEERKQAVLDSPAYRDAQSLVDVEHRAADAEKHAEQAAERQRSAQEDHDLADGDATRARQAVVEAESDVDRMYVAAGESADAAGISWTVARDGLDSSDVRATLRALATERRRDIADVRAALDDARTAATRAEQASQRAEQSSEAADVAERDRDAAAAAVDEARDALRAEVRAWADRSGLDELAIVAAGVDDLGEPDALSLSELANEAMRPRRDELTTRAARAADQLDELTAERQRVRDERQRVADEPVPAPDRMPTRPGDRTRRAGAPLYACCDFSDHVPDDERAGLEAAIEAAGLLDAWLGPRSDELDAWLRATPSTAGDPAPSSLADVLVATPPDGSSLTTDEIHGVLSSIALADTGIAVLPDGRFHLGPLNGRYSKPDAEFIGATAREQRRRRLLAELDARIAELDAAIEAAESEREAIAAEQRRLDEIARTVPSARELSSARETMLAAITTARERRAIAERDATTAREAREVSERLRRELHRLASQRNLPPTIEGLAEHEQRVHAYEQGAGELVGAVSSLTLRRDAARGADERLARAAETLAQRSAEHDGARRDAAALRSRVDELRAQLGADADAPLRQLRSIETELAELGDQIERLRTADSHARERRGKAAHEHAIALGEVERHEGIAAAAAERLQVLRRRDLWTIMVGETEAPGRRHVAGDDDDAGPRDVGDGSPDGDGDDQLDDVGDEDAGDDDADGVGDVSPNGDVDAPADAHALAAAIAEATSDLTDDADEPDDNELQRAYRVLLDELGRGYDPGLSYVDRVAVVEVTSEQGSFSILWLATELEAQVARQQELLSERDREIFERHLLTRVSEALRELLNDADELIGRINESLADRPTASGKSVHLRWELATDDPAVRRAVGLLRKTPELLGPDERERLRRFFSTAISQRRAEDPSASYVEILRQVLDYRSWHAFVPHVRSAGGGLQRLTRTLFRSLSGGEQAVVLHLPLFAAAAAHYDASHPSAPRLIALDEAFAGIDEGMRAELMGLLVRFDLDVLLTGHELWGAYEQVPSTMIYDLLRQPPLEGVSAFAVRWDGAAMAEA